MGVEFLVIVAGVLIALAVDRGVQGVDEGALERTYLEGLLEDFQSGARDAEYAAEFIGRRQDMIQMLIDVIESGQAPDSVTADDLARALELAGWHPPVTFPRVTWEDLINTGRLGLITNASLRGSVAEFYVELDWSIDLDATWREWMLPVQREAGYFLSPDLRLAVTRAVFNDTTISVEPPDREQFVAALTERPETLRQLGQALLVAELAGGTLAGTVTAAREVAALLEAELDR